MTMPTSSKRGSCQAAGRRALGPAEGMPSDAPAISPAARTPRAASRRASPSPRRAVVGPAIGEPTALDWATADIEIERLFRTDPHAALDLAARWQEYERDAGSVEGAIRALRSHGQALRWLGRYDAAIVAFEEAERGFRALGLEDEVARTYIGHVVALRYKGRYVEAIDLASWSWDYFRERGDDLQAAKQALNLGTVYRPMGRLADALHWYGEARKVFRRLGEQTLTATVEQNIGNLLVDLGRYEEALRRLHTAERIRRRLGLRIEVAQTLLNIGILSRRRGDYGRALQVLTEAGQINESLGDERGARLVDLQILSTSVALNLREESRSAAERAVGGLRTLDMPWELGQALLAAGAVAELSGDVGQAVARIDEARAIFDRLGNQVWEALARLQRARLMLGPGADGPVDESGGCAEDGDRDAPVARRDAAPVTLQQALAGCRDATETLEAAGALDHGAFGRLVEAALLARLSEHGLADRGEALSRYRDVINAAGALHADHWLHQAHAAIGDLLHADNPEAAAESYRRAIDHLEAVRSRARANDLKLSFLADKADLYERLVGLLVEVGTLEALTEAYSVVERSKSRSLLEDLLNGAAPARGGRQSRVARLAQRVRDLRTRLNSAYVLAYGGEAVPSLDSVSRSGHAEAVTRLEEEFAQATRELQLAATPGRGEAGPAAGDSLPRPPRGVALVEFYAVGQELLAFVITEGGLCLRRVTTLDEVATLAERLNFHIGKLALGAEYVRANLDKLRTGIERPLQQLYRAVVAPLEDDLRGYERLVIVPHGPLHGLPFHAFHDGTGYLAERFTIGYAPSGGVYRACVGTSRPLGDRALVVGIDDPGLPWVAREVAAVASAWPDATALQGRKATGRALRRQVGRFDVLHLATHGVFRADNPAFSSLKLHDAWLTVNDLAELARGAQLVTLSACETGVNGLTVGDEVVGLTRGILAAGCSTVVASLWTVSDESTAHLMERFYACLRDGAEPAEALRTAMLALRGEYDHPYYWAAFAAVGGGLGRPGPAG